MNNILRLAPEIAPNIVPEEQVAVSRLANLLDAAVIDHEMTEGGAIYAKDGLEFPVWVDILPDAKLIMFYTYMSVGEDAAKYDMSTVNKMNANIIAVQFHLADDKIKGCCWMSYDGGLNNRQFIKMLRRFSGAFIAGIQLD